MILAPLLAPGYVLRYDMVFTPHQPLGWDLLSPADALPRAVPQDALVSLASVLVPGWLLQRLALGAVIWAAAVGAGRLVPTRRRLTRVVAAVGYAWTPFLAERLLLGQWGLLLAYAALPWLVTAAMGLAEGRPRALLRLVAVAAPAAITPTGGVIALLTVAVLAGDRTRRALAAVASVAALNAPWILAALASSADGRSDPGAVAAFAARGENWAGPWLALAATGGIWNADTTPASRRSALVPLVTLALLAFAVAGATLLRRRWPHRPSRRLGLLAVGSIAVAALGVLPGGGGLPWFVTHVPGAGLLRDGQKFLLPYACWLAVCAALGVERLAARFTQPAERSALPADRVVLAGLALLPIVALPDLAFGAAGRLRPVPYPADWQLVAQEVAARPGPVLSLPAQSYRAYPWNPTAVVLDPLPRFLPAPVITDDTLVVGSRRIPGESARARRIRADVEAGRPVAAPDVRWVVVQSGASAPAPSVLDGLRLVRAGPTLTLYENPQATTHSGGGVRHLVAMAIAALVALVTAGCAAVAGQRAFSGART